MNDNLKHIQDVNLSWMQFEEQQAVNTQRKMYKKMQMLEFENLIQQRIQHINKVTNFEEDLQR